MLVTRLSAVTPSLNVDVPVTAKVLDNVVAPVTAKVEVAVAAPSMFVAPLICNASATVIADESSELKVVPAILTADAKTPPVPDGIILISSLDLADVILKPLMSKFPPSCGDVSSITKLVASSSAPYNSVKLSLILSNAVLNGSPVPSFALHPMLIVCFAICCYLFKYFVNRM